MVSGLAFRCLIRYSQKYRSTRDGRSLVCAIVLVDNRLLLSGAVNEALEPFAHRHRPGAMPEAGGKQSCGEDRKDEEPDSPVFRPSPAYDAGVEKPTMPSYRSARSRHQIEKKQQIEDCSLVGRESSHILAARSPRSRL